VKPFFKHFNMKKHLLSIVVLAFAFMTTTTADAQIRFGVKAGLNLNSLSLSGSVGDNLKSTNRGGFFAGLTADVTVPLIGIGADVAVLYDQRDAKIEGTYVNETTKIRYISIPINVKYTLGFSSIASAYIATGPQFSFNLDKGKVSDYLDKKDIKSADFFWNVGAGVTLLDHFRVGYTYNIPLGKTADGNVNVAGLTGQTFSAKVKTHQISLTYLF